MNQASYIRRGTLMIVLAGFYSVGALAGTPEEAAGSDPAALTIQVESGTWGENCRAPHGNATRDLARRCDGRGACEYVLTGTAADVRTNACQRDFRAQWRCGAGEFHVANLSAAARPGDTLVLSCARSTGAGK